MEKEKNKDFYSLYKQFVIGAVPKYKKVPGFLLKRPLMEILSKCDEGVLRSLSASMKEKDFRECVEKITVPVSYFYAVPGSLFSPELADWYKEHVHTAFQAFPFEGCSHMLVSEQPDLFAKYVTQCLTSLKLSDFLS